VITIEDYLERIGITTTITTSYDCLALLQLQHLKSVPFENLDILSGRKIECTQEHFLEKIVTRHRGGFCYELNGAFSWLLCELGFDITVVSARVGRDTGGFGPEFDHFTIIAHLDEDYLVDVGFGNFSSVPVPISGRVVTDGIGEYRVWTNDDYGYAYEQLADESWKPNYVFSHVVREVQEFTEMCKYHQTSSESPFTSKEVCSILTNEGRLTISGNSLIETVGDSRSTRDITDEERIKLLQTTFGIRELIAR
jgi:N-hydroxyarylamine O-acetyltransferase